MQSARHMRGVEAVENQQEKTFFHPEADEEERRIFKKKIRVYELMRISLIYIVHKSERIQEAVQAAGCLLEYLPPYSPDLNPIEHKWAQAKALKRKLACSTDELFKQPCL